MGHLNHAPAHYYLQPERLIALRLTENILNVRARRLPPTGRVPADRADAILHDYGGAVLVLLRDPLFPIPYCLVHVYIFYMILTS